MKLSTKLPVAAVLCAVLPLLAIIALSFNIINESLTKTVKETLQVRAVEELETLQRKLTSAKHQLNTLSMLSTMRNVSSDGDINSLQEDLTRFAEQTPLFTEIIVANYSGIAVASSKSEYINTDLNGTWEFEAPKLGIEFDGPVVHSYRLDKMVATQSVPLFSDTIPKAIAGALIGTIDWQMLQSELSKGTLFGGQQDENRMVFLESMASQTDANRMLYGTAGMDMPAMLLSSATDDGQVKEISMDNKPYMMVSVLSKPNSEFRDPQWRLHMLLDSDIAYAGIRGLEKMYMFAAALLLLLVTGVSYMVSRSIVNPVNALVTSAEKLAAGDFDHKLPESHSQDEISQLTRSFDAMRTAVKINEQELVQKTAAAEHAAKLKGEFLANMSHEVRTPINGVLGMTDLLLNTPLEKKQIRYAETISRSGKALLAVINDILDFSKIEAGKLELTESVFDLRLMVEDIAEMLVDAAHRKGVELIVDIPPGSHVAFNGDANRLRQVLINLMGNAIKFTNEGEITVRLSIEDTEHNRVLAKFEVNDTGIGVPEEQRSSIFESFVQADGTTTRNFGGTGLGLTISSKLAELMGGNIGMHGRASGGSTFWFTAVLEKVSIDVQEAWQSDNALAGKRVLIVDDNDTNREILSEQVSFWGANSVCVSSGAKALVELENAHEANTLFDIAILDMQMPHMNGLDLATCINKHELAIDTRLVLLSSSSEHDLTEFESMGITTVAIKPVRQIELYNSLTAVITDRDIQCKQEKNIAQKIDKNIFKGNVLVVEDNPVNQDMMLEVLRQFGINATLANNGEDALKTLEKYSFDVVLMDCQMPVMDGFAATEAIRAKEQKSGKGKRLPIVALTANAMEGDRQRCVESGMDEYMSKPVSNQDLKTMLSKWLELVDTTDIQAVSNEPDSDSLPVIDAAIFSEVSDMCAQASAGFFGSLLDKYKVSSASDIKLLTDAIASRDGNSVGSIAHRLKSSSVSWGGKAMGNACQLLENAGKSEHLDTAADLLNNVCREHSRLLDALQHEEKKAA